MISRPDIIDRCPDGEDHVFDGAHKLEAVFDFIDDKFAFRTKKSAFSELHGKRFSEVPRDVQDRIKKYRFHINHVDVETAESPDELRILWERVNKAGKRLNRFELDLPVIAPLIEQVLRPSGDQFRETIFFPKEVSSRGSLEQRLQIVLALTDLDEYRASSQANLIQRWHAERLGATMVERSTNIEREAEGWRAALDRAYKILVDLEQLNVFCTDDGVPTILDAHRSTELPFILGRLARAFPRIEDFRSQKVAIAGRLKVQIFGRSLQELSVFLGVVSVARNGTFQQKLVKFIDGLVSAEIVQPRLFTTAQKKQKLKDQGGLCKACDKKILAHHLFDGDHVIEWSEGGETTLENLQILHRVCHQAKVSGI
jgi:hypothetical protein